MMFSQYHNTHRKFKRLAKALIRLRVRAGWSESSLVAHITLLEISCRGSFQRRDDARGSLRLAQDVITSWRNVIRIVTSRHGDHAAACLEELSLLFKLLVIEKKSLWLKYDFNINKTGIFAIHFYFLYFFNVNDDHDIFLHSRIRFLVRSRLVPRIDSV